MTYRTVTYHRQQAEFFGERTAAWLRAAKDSPYTQDFTGYSPVNCLDSAIACASEAWRHARGVERS